MLSMQIGKNYKTKDGHKVGIVYYDLGGDYYLDRQGNKYYRLELDDFFEEVKGNEMKIEVGKSYKDNKGLKHEIVHYNLKADMFVSSFGECFKNGYDYSIDDPSLYLIEEWKEPKSGVYWMNVYERPTGFGITRGLSESKLEADNHARNCCTNKRLACVRIEWKEGQFDE